VEWFYARFGAGRVPGGPEVAAARRALRCGGLRDLIEATTAPLTASRFVDNLGVSLRTRSLRVAPEPRAAARQLCR
jgi:arabinofuranosyltransferase